ncbi:MBL fold metallo-hydrolase [Paenibacillus lautus]|uniref:MBL fold metallo-hydrolase n=1 Tax=Paenibacillus lautus TaxID=1401 RepID=UPI003D9A8F09
MNYLVHKEAAGFFAVEVKPDIYLIGCEVGENGGSWGRSMEFGSPTGNSWLIKGQETSVLIDSALPLPGFKAFAEKVAQTPVQLVLSHAHPDHIYRLKEFDEYWIHPDDEGLLRGEYGFNAYEGIPETIHYLKEGDVLDIGNGHVIHVYHVPGHTDGSVLLLDEKTKSLFASDTIARRLLYGLGTWIPLDRFIHDLQRIKSLDFESIYTCHDRTALSKKFIDFMIDSLKGLPEVQQRIELIGMEFIHLVSGNEKEETYFDFVVPAARREESIEALKRV